MANETSFTIPHIGLKKSVHEWLYQLDAEFFKKYEHSLIEDAKIDVKVRFDKSSTPYIIDFDINGTFKTECDKCAADVWLPIHADFRVYVKFHHEAEEVFDDNLEILFISKDEPEIDVEPFIYDFISLSIPYSKVCDDPGNTPYCDLEVMNILKNKPKEENQSTDPRWEGLNKLKDLN